METNSIFAWSSIQGHILTGGDKLNDLTKEGIDYQVTDLPHYHLIHKTTKKAISQWLASNKRSFSIVGCWNRPIFSGGWLESTIHDTDAFNLQTPSIFVDMRIPIRRPTEILRVKRCLEDCSDMELRILARQHCFSGYTLPEMESIEENGLLFTRHHVIDWNYHPNYPRPRPNRWWVDVKDDKTSFKEYSFARDSYGIPLYYERWQRRIDDTYGEKYFAMRKRIECPFMAIENGRIPQRDSILVVVGNYFILIRDRSIAELPSFESYSGPSSTGCALLVDYALEFNYNNRGREYAIALLDLICSYGTIVSKSSSNQWNIIRSTHPWLENTSLVDDSSQMDVEMSVNNSVKSIRWNGEIWDVLENSFDINELQRIFPVNKMIPYSLKTILKSNL